MDGAARPKTKGKKGGGDGGEEETELIHNSSEEETDEDGDLTSVATTPPMKPVITDRSEHTRRTTNKDTHPHDWVFYFDDIFYLYGQKLLPPTVF